MRLNDTLYKINEGKEKEVRIFSSRGDLKSNEFETDKASKMTLVQRVAKLQYSSKFERKLQTQWPLPSF